MAKLRQRDSASSIERFTLKHSTTGVGLTGLDNTSSGLIISTVCDNEVSATVYTVAASNVETIATLGTYAAPTASKCRFKEVDAVNHPGLYEFQFADARYAVASSLGLVISVSGATDLLDADYEIELSGDTFETLGSELDTISSQIGNIAITGAAVNTSATTAVVAVGDQTNTYTATAALDGIYHQIDTTFKRAVFELQSI